MAGEAQQEKSSDQGRPSTVVVTSENLTEFNLKKLGIEAPKADAEALAPASAKAEGSPKANGETDVDDLLEAERKAEQDPKKHRLNVRFSELTGKRKEAEAARDAARADADREKSARLAAEAKLAELSKGAKGDEEKGLPPADAKPDRAKFPAGPDGDAAYTEAVIDYRADQRIAARDAKVAESTANGERKQVLDAWQKNQVDIVKVIPDYREVIAKATCVLSDEVRDAIVEMEGEAGPRTLYYFAQFPEEAGRLGKLTVGAALRELGKIEAKVAKKAEEKKDEPKKDEPKSDVEISKAPRPAEPLQTHGGPAAYEDDKGNLLPSVTPSEYRRLRKEKKIR